MKNSKTFLLLVAIILAFSSCTGNSGIENNTMSEIILSTSENELIDSNASDEEIIVVDSAGEEVTASSAIVINYSLPELIGLSDSTVLAKCVGYEKSEDYTKTFFETQEIFSGKITDKFTVYQYPTACVIEETGIEYMSGNNEFINGSSYILALEEDSSVFYEESKFLLLGDFYALINDNSVDNISYYGIKQEKVFNDLSEAREFITNSKDNFFIRKDEKVPFTRSENTEDIISTADYVLEVEIIDISNDSEDRTSYNAVITDCLKGKSEGEIFAVLPKNSVSIGNKYIIAFNRVNKDSLVYVISSLKGIYDSSDRETLAELCVK